jgi:hypothetical protein
MVSSVLAALLVVGAAPQGELPASSVRAAGDVAREEALADSGRRAARACSGAAARVSLSASEQALAGGDLFHARARPAGEEKGHRPPARAQDDAGLPGR